jgi:hypothetical protein
MKTLSFGVLGTALVSVTLTTHGGSVDQDERAHLVFNTQPIALPSPAATLRDTTDYLNEVIQEHCVRCHGERRQQGNLALHEFDVGAAEQDAQIAERIIRKLRVGMMPPAGARRPGADTLVALAAALETRIDETAAIRPNPGRRTFQRLNRAEYELSIRDLLDIEIEAGDYLPLDTKSANFDNIADVQLLSPTLMDGYLRAASEISRLAVGDPNASPSETQYRVSRLASQREHVEGAPFGTRGGTSVVHNFPADAEYIFKVSYHHETTGDLFGNGRGALHTAQAPEQLEIAINGERAVVLEIDRWMHTSDPDGVEMRTDPIFIAAGPQRVSAAFVRRFEGPMQDLVSPHDWSLASTSVAGAYGFTSVPHLRDLVISGPYNATGVSETPSRRRVFSCYPDTENRHVECAREIVTRLGTRAYRRPLGANDIDALMSFYEMGAEEGGFETGVRVALEAMLTSPHFVFRFEEPPAAVAPGEDFRISDLALASRLSFFLWSSAPDQQLLDLARDGQLSQPDVLAQQVDRMLADSRSETLGSRFAGQWLRLQDLDKIRPDVRMNPDFDLQLSDAMRRETELFFNSLVRDDRSMFELLTADYTFVNQRLATHYDIPGIPGDHFRRVHLDDPNRRGLLGHASILTLTSHAIRSSPVLRGKWVMEVLLGSPPPPPPPNVPDLEATEEAENGRLLSVRERLEIHRSNPACRSCHQMMDPIGLALENFDATGAWRIKDNGVPIDVASEMWDQTPINGPHDLRQALLDRPESVRRNFIENLMAFAIGRRIEYFDMPAVRQIERAAVANGDRMSVIIKGVVNSTPFQMSRAEDAVSSDEGQNGQ